MNSISIFFVQSAICMAFFYAVYWLFLRNETFFRINRLFLLLTLIASMLIPGLEIPFQVERLNPAENPANILDAVVVTSQEFLSSIQLDEVIVPATAQKSVSWILVVSWIYMLGCLFYLGRFGWNLVQLVKWVRKSERIPKDGFQIVLLDEDFPPFSFFSYVFMNRADYEGKDLKAILAHERVHIQQQHTVDLLIIELVCILMWFNPFTWIYKFSLQEVHEYLADDQVVHGPMDPLVYKKSIIRQFVGADLFKMANNFGQSTLKKRITMLGRMKSPKLAVIKVLLVIPVIFLLVSAFAFTVYEEKKLNAVSHEVDEFGDTKLPFLNEFMPYLNRFVPGEEQNEMALSHGIDRLQHKKADPAPEEVYVIVEDMPKFPGGPQGLYKFLSRSVKYPEQALKKNLSGRVFVSFVVNQHGMVEKPKIARGVHPVLDREALRVVSNLPRWTPGKQKGKNVKVTYTVPINFVQPDYRIEPIFAVGAIKEVEPFEVEVQHDYELAVPFIKDQAYIAVEKMPNFPGGLKALRRYLAQRIEYPQMAIECGQEGQVYVSFVVNQEGKITGAEVKKGVSRELNHEALRVIQSMPKWEPGEQSGQKVSVSYTVPIRFALR